MVIINRGLSCRPSVNSLLTLFRQEKSMFFKHSIIFAFLVKSGLKLLLIVEFLNSIKCNLFETRRIVGLETSWVFSPQTNIVCRKLDHCSRLCFQTWWADCVKSKLTQVGMLKNILYEEF